MAETALIDALTSALTLWRSMSLPQPLRLPFTETAATSKYFQSLFALVQKNHEPLQSLWQAVDGTLSGYFSDKASWPDFMPHLSLLYGTEEEVSPATKAEVILQLEKSGVFAKDDSGLLLNGVRELPAKVCFSLVDLDSWSLSVAHKGSSGSRRCSSPLRRAGELLEDRTPNTLAALSVTMESFF